MTNKQHIENLKKLKSFHNGSYGADIDRAIKALEQEPKIVPIAEIKFDDDMLHEIVEETVKNIEIEIEPKTGHWRHYEGMLICSECGTEFYDDIMEYCGDDVPKCCPNCGARMVDPQKSEE